MLEDKNIVDSRVYRILLVDDEKQVLNAMRETLERGRQFKSKIVTAGSGLEALTELESQNFDIVLSDFKMPVSSRELTMVSMPN